MILNILNKSFTFLSTRPRLTLVVMILWTTVILVACFLPGKDFPNVPVFQADKLVHIGLFGGCSLVWSFVFLKEAVVWTKMVYVFLGTVGLGILVELIQSTSLVIGRSGDVWDVVADSVGALLGVLFFRYGQNLKNAIKR